MGILCTSFSELNQSINQSIFPFFSPSSKAEKAVVKWEEGVTTGNTGSRRGLGACLYPIDW